MALKASNAPEELLEAQNALNLLFSKVEDNLSYALPNGDPRYITVVEKKKKHLTSTQERLACPTNAHFKQWCPLFKIQKTIYKINFALVFLGSGKIRLQNGPRSHFWAREK